jgi:RNA polymerase sigma-70 factor (ECF subfamily)
MTSERVTPSNSTPGDYFATTRWTLVTHAARRDGPQAEQALEELCRTYWYPLYAYVRRRGHSHEDAEDLVQSFFARLIQKDSFDGLDAEKGKFRAFLLAALKHFLANEWDRAHRQKRGGDAVFVSLDWKDADSRYQIDPPDHLSPDKLYDRAWAMVLLEHVIALLRAECAAEGKLAHFEQLKPFLMLGKGAISYAEAGAALGLAAGAVRVAVYRLRRRYRDLLRDEIVQTLVNPAQAEEELRTLFSAFEG